MSDFNKDEYLNDLPDMDDLSGQAARPPLPLLTALPPIPPLPPLPPLAQRRKVQLSRLPRNRKKMAIPLPLTVLTRQALPTAKPTIR